MRFIDTDAGRQLLIDSFHAKTAYGFVDPNFLEWQDEWPGSPYILDDIKKLYEEWIAKGCLKSINDDSYYSFTQEVIEYLAKKQQEWQKATYTNYEEYLDGTPWPSRTDPEILLSSVHRWYDSDNWEYEEDYKQSLKSSVAQKYYDLAKKYKINNPAPKKSSKKLTLEDFKKDPKIAIILEICRNHRFKYSYNKGIWPNFIPYELDLDRLYEFYLKDENDHLLFPENLVSHFKIPSHRFEKNFITYCETAFIEDDSSGVLLFSQIFDIERRDLEDPENFVEDERCPEFYKKFFENNSTN